MRYVIVIASLTLAVSSILLDRRRPGPDSWLCREGFCRADQAAADTGPPAPQAPEEFTSLANEDASDPYVWAAYADSLTAHGDLDKASAAIDHATRLGPGLPPLLIRAAYFDFTHDQFDRGAALSNRILGETATFDPLVFSYLEYFRKGSSPILGTAIPAASRPAQSWAAWIGTNGSPSDVLQTWRWMKQNRLADAPSALDLTWKLWHRQFFRSAQELWSDWNGPAGGDHPARELGLARQLVFNGRFRDVPNGSPFDWAIPAQASVHIFRGQGLDLHFMGVENVKLDGIRQSTVVSPGRYRFSALIQSEGLTTDQGPFFRIFDPQNSSRLNVQTAQIKGTTARSDISCEFIVPAGTEALTIQLERRESERFDNKIQGTLHVYEVSLIPHDQPPK